MAKAETAERRAMVGSMTGAEVGWKTGGGKVVYEVGRKRPALVRMWM